jgi:CubicO group peptidase (beta-lactamase class C family)
MIRAGLAALALTFSAVAAAREPAGLDAALKQLERDGKFSGAVVIRGAEGVRFARGYGMADPFTRRAFTPDTPLDSASAAKPVTAAAVLLLAAEAKIDLDAPVQRYVPEYPHRGATVRHLIAHSAGLAFEETAQRLAGKTNRGLLDAVRKSGAGPLFPPGTAFDYCNLCYSTLALLVERVTGTHFLTFAQDRLALPSTVTIRPPRLADWKRRAIGYRRTADGRIERFDSWEGEEFYGSANFSISASELARWAAQWWQPRLAPIRTAATEPATITGKTAGLSWGSWYCASDRQRCHYGGHHEGFHHLLYWDSARRISVAMVSNNALSPALQQRLQRALVALAEARSAEGLQELSSPLSDLPVHAGRYRLSTGETVLLTGQGKRMTVERRGLRYTAYLIGTGIRYVPGLDVYVTGAPDGRLHWLSLYEDAVASPVT